MDRITKRQANNTEVKIVTHQSVSKEYGTCMHETRSQPTINHLISVAVWQRICLSSGDYGFEFLSGIEFSAQAKIKVYFGIIVKLQKRS